MTEAEWADCEDCRMMLHHLLMEAAGQSSRHHRPARLAAIAVMRNCWAFGAMGKVDHAAILVAERMADGLLDHDGEAAVRKRYNGKTDNDLLLMESGWDALDQAINRKSSRSDWPLVANVLRDTFRPFGTPLEVPVAWRTPDVRTLSRAAYTLRLPGGRIDPLRMAVLCDALEEAGLDDCHDIHFHLRGLVGCDVCEGAMAIYTDPRRLDSWAVCPKCKGEWLPEPPCHRGCAVLDALIEATK